ncbi:MAG: magnesium/cobalt transporter CorA [Methanospirillaceae archaeon]|nr:magnesium/cobalt transporter CorA [Methanospirillaceae archaeon]
MTEHQKKISSKSGLPPGIPVYIGDKKPITTHVTIIQYDEKGYSEELKWDPENLNQVQKKDEVTWIHVSGLEDIIQIENICHAFDIHPLVIEDILNTKSREKVEDFGTYLFTILSKIAIADKIIIEEQVTFILLNQILISFSESDTPFSLIIDHIHHQNGKIRQSGSDYLLYTLIDTIVDNYFIVLEQLEDTADELDIDVLTIMSSETIGHIQSFKRDLAWFRRHIWSLRNIVNHLERTDSHLVNKQTHLYMRDVYDHTLNLSEEAEALRDTAEGLMEIYLSNLSNNTNEIMKVLTQIAVIFIPLSFVTSFYGMNFEYMPELHHPHGYPIVIGAMVAVVVIMILFFKTKKWI